MADLTQALNAALGPVLAQLANQVGVRVAIYRPTETALPDGSPRRTYTTPDPAWSTAAAFFRPGSTSGPGSDTLGKPFGVRTTAFGSITFVQNAAGVVPVLSPFDGIKILDGPYAGYTWLVEADHVPDPIGLTGAVRLVAAPAGVLP